MTASDLFANCPELDSIARDGMLGWRALAKDGGWARGKTPEEAVTKLSTRTIL